MRTMLISLFVIVLSVSVCSCGKSQSESRQKESAWEPQKESAANPAGQPKPASPQRLSQGPTDIMTVFEESIIAPAGMAMASDGTLFVVTRRKAGQVYKIPIRNGQNQGPAVFSSSNRFFESRHIAIDGGGFVYVSAGLHEAASAKGMPTFRISEPPGIYQISPDGRSFERIEYFQDETGGLICDPDGHLLCCGCSPHKQEETNAKTLDRTLDKLFGDSSGGEPYLKRIEREAEPGKVEQTTVFKHLDARPVDITVDSEGNLFYAADGMVKKIDSDFKGEPAVFATLPITDLESTDSLGIGIDNVDNLYVGTANIYAPAGGIVYRIGPAGNVGTFATGLSLPMDIVSDAGGNVYISDVKANKIFQVPAIAQGREGPFTLKIIPPPTPVVPKAAVPVAEALAPADESPAETEETALSAPVLSAPPVEPEEEEAEETPESVTEGVPSGERPEFPDKIILQAGREIECEIISETEDSVRIRTAIGTVSVLRGRIESVQYGVQPKPDTKPSRTEEDESG